MKIEIEDNQLVWMKNRIAELEKECNLREAKISSLDEEKLVNKAVSLAKIMCGAYFNAVAEKLGFYHGYFQVNQSYDINNLIAEFGQIWLQQERIVVTISADVTKEFSKAFLSIGVIPPAERKKFALTLNN